MNDRQEMQMTVNRLTKGAVRETVLANPFRASSKQVGGEHYKHMQIQPMELAYSIGGSPAFILLVRYITRIKGDFNKRYEDIEKGIHIIQLEHEMVNTLSFARSFSLFLKKTFHLDTTQVNQYTDLKLKRFADQFPDCNGQVYACLRYFVEGHYGVAISVLEAWLAQVSHQGYFEERPA